MGNNDLKIFLDDLIMRYNTIGNIDGVKLATLIAGLHDNDDNHQLFDEVIEFCNQVYNREKIKNNRVNQLLRKGFYDKED